MEGKQFDNENVFFLFGYNLYTHPHTHMSMATFHR